MSKLKLSILALGSSILYLLSFPNFNFSSFAWLALVPLSLLARRSTPRQAFLWGWLAGALAYSGILYWIIVTFQAAHLSIGLAILCLSLLAGYLGLYWGVWAWFLTSVIPRGHWRGTHHALNNNVGSRPTTCRDDVLGPLAGAAAWVALEYLRTYLFSGFPWALLADSQVRMLPLIQISSITGVYGVSFLVVLVNLTITAVIPAEAGTQSTFLGPGFRRGDILSRTIPTVLIVFSCGLFGLHRIHRPADSSPLIKIALLQGSIDQYKKWDKNYVEEIEKTYEALVQEAARAKPDMIIWPETSVPGYLLQDPQLRDWLLKVVRESKTNHLIGAPIIHNEMAYNSAFSIDSKCNLLSEYAKQHLVPFGEVVPWSRFLGRFIKVLNDLGGFTAGTSSPVLQIGGTAVGVNICYEAIFPNLVRQSVRQGAQIIANLTNDGWYMRSAAPYQHWTPNVFRAVENDRWLIRADNTGITGIIDPVGHVQASSTIFESCVVTGTVAERSFLTPYTKYGDIFVWICCVFAAFLLIRKMGLLDPKS